MNRQQHLVMNKDVLLLTAGIALALSSCSTTRHTAHYESVDTKVYNLTVADMDVSTARVSKTTSWNWNPLNTVSLAVEKNNTSAEILEEAGADVLVEPQYVVKRRGLFRGGSVTVSGYPAKYKGFRSMTMEDATMIGLAEGKVYDVASAPVVTAAKRVTVADIKPSKPKYVRQFIDLIGGGAFADRTPQHFSNCSNADVGFMWGIHGRKWGGYVKGGASVQTGDSKGSPQELWQLTIGAIKTLSSNMNAFFGLGVGESFGYYEESINGYYWGDYRCLHERVIAVPVEFGFQWTLNHFNMLAGVNVSVLTNTKVNNVNVGPFVGVGYSF